MGRWDIGAVQIVKEYTHIPEKRKVGTGEERAADKKESSRRM